MRLALAVLWACVACGRIRFDPAAGAACTDVTDCSAGELCAAGTCQPCAAACDDGNPCTDDGCAAGSCTHVANVAPCDDGDACTTGDRCTLGVCGGGPATGCASVTQPIFRSVGSAVPALAANAGSLTITGTTAAFSGALADRIGVGDVIQYDSDGNGSSDALAFIHGRLSSQVYLVRTSAGGTPAPTAGASATWAVFRAYLSLANAVDRTAGGTRNPSITAAFDGYAGGRDLVASNEQWNVACYDDGTPDSAGVAICDTGYTRSCTTGSWTTDATHFLRIYTPTSVSEVGTSQRHHGTWGTGYRRTDGIILYQGFVHLDGMALQRTTVGNGRTYYVETEGHGGEVWISNSVGWTSMSGNKVFDIWDTGAAALGPTYTVYKLWNDIAYSAATTDPRAGIYLNSNRADAYVFNCTSYVKGGGAFYESSNARATLKNCVGYTEAANAFAADNGFQLVSSSVSNDASLNGIMNGVANAWTQSLTFLDAAGNDYHLDPSAAQNLAVRGQGQNLSGDPMLPFTDDIDGDPRPVAPNAWDTGADQVYP